MNIIATLLDWLRLFWPFVVVHSYERGVRFWLGRDTALLEPGVHMFLPFFGSIHTIAVVQDYIRLGNQNLTTKDGKPVLVSCNIRYEVTDARSAFVDVQEFPVSLGDLARQALSSQIREYEYPELLANQSGLEKDIRHEINKASQKWGVKVTNVGLADFILTRSYSVANV
jgi:regulator of protease activity HflC (stomatin/prohibitin superfamily)